MTQSRLLRFARLENRSLRENERPRFAAAHALNIYQSDAIYTMIPKNACSTMRLSLALANGCIASPSEGNWIHLNNDAFSATLRDLNRANYTFVILRDPYARLASCFLDKFVSKRRPAKDLRDLVGTDTDLDAICFADFVSYLEDDAILAANMHWQPQIDFLVYERYDDYFAFERISAAAAIIHDRARLQVVDARSLTAHGLDRFRILPADSGHSRTPVRDIAAMQQDGHSPNPRSLYTQSIVKTVARLNARDLDLYAETIGLPTLFTAD